MITRVNWITVKKIKALFSERTSFKDKKKINITDFHSSCLVAL